MNVDTIKNAEFEFMLDLKNLISRTAIEPELTRLRASMRREDRETTLDGNRPVFDKLSMRWDSHLWTTKLLFRRTFEDDNFISCISVTPA